MIICCTKALTVREGKQKDSNNPIYALISTTKVEYDNVFFDKFYSTTHVLDIYKKGFAFLLMFTSHPLI